MKIIILGLALIATSCCFASPDCSLKRLALLDVSVTDHVTMPVTINGQQTLMQFSSSGGYNLITSDEVARLKLRLRKLARKRIMIGTEWVRDYVQVESLQVGNIRFHQVDFVVSPASYSGPRKIEAPEAGIISGSTFANFDLELDLSNNKVALYSPDHCGGQVVYWTDAAATIPIHRGDLGAFYFPMEVEGKKLEATVSTGGTTSLEEAVSRKLYGFDRHSPNVRWSHSADGTLEPSYLAMKLTADGFYVANADVRLQASWDKCKVVQRKPPYDAVGFDGCLGRYPLVIGIDALKKLHLYFATKEDLLYLTSANVRARTDQRESGH